VRKILRPPGFVLILLFSLYFIRTSFFICIVLTFLPSALTVQKKTSMPPTGYFCSLFVLCISLCLLSWFLSFLLTVQHTQHNTNIHDPGRIRTHNPSRREATDLRCRPRGHWDQRFRSSDRPACSESLYRLSYPSPTGSGGGGGSSSSSSNSV
jgi:hypothetical protein